MIEISPGLGHQRDMEIRLEEQKWVRYQSFITSLILLEVFPSKKQTGSWTWSISSSGSVLVNVTLGSSTRNSTRMTSISLEQKSSGKTSRVAELISLQ